MAEVVAFNRQVLRDAAVFRAAVAALAATPRMMVRTGEGISARERLNFIPRAA
ncbi:MAG: hypothetical protein ACK4P8_07505 [Tabrizicola sp.]